MERFPTRGFVGVCASAQNIDRVVSIYRACKRTGRTLVLDLYALESAGCDGKSAYPAGRMAQSLRSMCRNISGVTSSARNGSNRGPLQAASDLSRDARQVAPRAVMLFRPAMLHDIDLMPGAWDGARMIWSQWERLSAEPRQPGFQAKLAERGVTLEVIHTSGHASIVDLKRLAEAMAPDVLVPVHTFEGDRYHGVFGAKVRPSAGRRMVGGVMTDVFDDKAGRSSKAGSSGTPLDTANHDEWLNEGEALLADIEGPEALKEARLLAPQNRLAENEPRTLKDLRMPKGKEWKFNRGLDEQFIAALKDLASDQQSWFAEVLHDTELTIGIRDNYINVYADGQSLFSANWTRSKQHINISTHPKVPATIKLKQSGLV